MPRIVVFFVPLILLLACNNKPRAEKDEEVVASSPAPHVTAPQGQWMDSLEAVANADSCGQKVAAQINYLEKEKLDTQYVFDKYPVSDDLPLASAQFNPNSIRSARMFKTKITEGLRDSGINFAGHYSIVDVPMTGWGSNFWIIDRKTGRAYEFPYKTNYLRFKKESNLLIMDPKEAILKNLKELDDFHNACVYQYSVSGQMFTDLRPFYFIWNHNKLQMLAGPPGEKPLSNSFWKDFFGNQ